MKKNLIILGGNNNCNINWLKKMCNTYKNDYETYPIYFDNWKDNSDMDFEKEVLKFKELTKKLKEYYIVAKSAGAIVSLIGIDRNIIKSKAIIIMGVPLKFANQSKINISELFNKISKKCKILVIQQKYDPQGKVIELEEILPSNISLISIKGNHHSYSKINYIKSFVDLFIKINK